MGAVLVDVADAVADALNDHDFGVVFRAERSYANWNDEFKDLGDVKVDVVPDADSPDLVNRGSLDYLCTVDILIRKRLQIFEQEQDTGRPMLEQIDELMQLVQDVYEFFAFQQSVLAAQDGELDLASGLTASWMPSTTRLVAHYIRGRLRQNLFVSVIRLGYEVNKEVG